MQQADATILDLPAIKEMLAGVWMQPKDVLEACLVELEPPASLPGTKCKAQVHLVLSDASGRPRVKDLAMIAAKRAMHYSIPRSKIAAARKQAAEGNDIPLLDLDREARALFTSLKTSGEGGELLLYLLTESVLGIPQVICKMPLKTNENQHFHGVDGVHACVDEESGRLAFYVGESKLHQTAKSAIDSCMKSIAPFLLDDGGSGGRSSRDIQLVVDHVDFDDHRLEASFREYLNPESRHFLKREIRGVCLVGFDVKAYPDCNDPDDMSRLQQEIKESLNEWRGLIEKAVKANKIENFVLEVFCLPFPEVQKFRDAFFAELSV